MRFTEATLKDCLYDARRQAIRFVAKYDAEGLELASKVDVELFFKLGIEGRGMADSQTLRYVVRNKPDEDAPIREMVEELEEDLKEDAIDVEITFAELSEI